MFIMIKITSKKNKMFICCVKTESLYKKTSKQYRLLTKTDVNIVNNIGYLQKPMST